MDIIAKFIQKETSEKQEYSKFTTDTDIGELTISLKNSVSPGFRYAIEVRKGETSEFQLFFTRFFADRCFEKMKKKWGECWKDDNKKRD